jgi:hypothetical protein
LIEINPLKTIPGEHAQVSIASECADGHIASRCVSRLR